MAEWLKRPTHNWRTRGFNSCWMQGNCTYSFFMEWEKVRGITTNILINWLRIRHLPTHTVLGSLKNPVTGLQPFRSTCMSTMARFPAKGISCLFYAWIFFLYLFITYLHWCAEEISVWKWISKYLIVSPGLIVAHFVWFCLEFCLIRYF